MSLKEKKNNDPLNRIYRVGDSVYMRRLASDVVDLLLEHAILLVGYGKTSEGVHYFTAMNSWGKGWGKKGYERIIRSISSNQKTVFHPKNRLPHLLVSNVGDSVYSGFLASDLVPGLVHHAILLVGYGKTSDDIHYFTAMNSWGKGWGKKGFGRIIRSISSNQKTLFNTFSFPK
ncbi:AN1 [Linum perenne]